MDVWNSADMSGRDAFQAWRDGLARAFVRLEPRRVTEAPFFGRITKAQCGCLAVSRVEASPHSVTRLRQFAECSEDLVFANLQCAGVGRTTQDEREVRTMPFDLSVADAAKPFEIVHKRRFSLLSIALPRTLVPSRLMREGALRMSASLPGRRFSSMLARYAELALDGAATDAARSVYGAHMASLLNLVAEMPNDGGANTRARVSLDMLKDFVHENSGDPLLSAQTLAEQFGVSERYVHKLFSGGDTVSEFIRAARLEACASLLASGSPDTVTTIALGAGFSDLSYFNRCFRQRYGETPSEYRRRARA